MPRWMPGLGGSTREAEKLVCSVLGWRWMKSKMPCPPAFMPVIRFDQATGLCGGMLVVSRRNDPFSASAAKFGILPSATYFFNSCGSMPSMPRMTSF